MITAQKCLIDYPGPEIFQARLFSKAGTLPKHLTNSIMKQSQRDLNEYRNKAKMKVSKASAGYKTNIKSKHMKT